MQSVAFGRGGDVPCSSVILLATSSQAAMTFTRSETIDDLTWLMGSPYTCLVLPSTTSDRLGVVSVTVTVARFA